MIVSEEFIDKKKFDEPICENRRLTVESFTKNLKKSAELRFMKQLHNKCSNF